MSESYLDSGVVFPPFKTHYTVLGVRAAAWPMMLACLLVCALLFVVLGTIQVDATEQMSAAEKSSAKHELVELRDAAKEISQAAAAAGTEDVSRLDVSSETRELASQASAKGITAKTTDTELAAMVPADKQVKKDAIDPIMRLFLFVVLPFLAVFMWHVEFPPGWSLSSELKRIRRHSKRQRIVVSRKREWLYGKEVD